ncbi:hypothetical protein [Streptomyces sp. NPDC051162]|uniref:hypothetical protein n=1 Tax=Streptomyces sp. NPDC051162 TaxID=3154747 RepID=UPI00342D846F
MSFGQGGPHGAPGEPHRPTPQWGPPPPPQPTPQPPPWGPAAGAPQTPDWSALADDTAARGRRRKWLLLGGGALAVTAVATAVAVTVTGSHGGGKRSGLPAPEKLPSSSGAPEPSFSDAAPPPPPNPLDFISSADKDKAPLSTGTLFPHTKPVLYKRAYDRTATATTTDCGSATQNGLGAVLTANGCRKVLRATYVRDGIAVTVGVAVFDDKAAADKAKDQSTGNIASLSGDNDPAFCRATACRLTANAQGRYAYFTVAGYANGKAVGEGDTAALTAGRDVSDYAFRRIMYRAQEQAADSVRSSAPPKRA